MTTKKIIYGQRAINLYSNKMDINNNLPNIEIMKFKNDGYFIIKNNKFYDAIGRFDFTFDGGLWKEKFLSECSA